MLAKLFKHEWKTASPLFLVVHGALLLFAILSRIYLQLSGAIDNMSNNWIALLLVFITVVVVASVAFFNYFYIAYRFYKNVFTDQGYLTNTLPVTPTQIMLSKGIVGILWIVIDIIILIASLFILLVSPSDLDRFFVELGKSFANIAHWGPFVWMTLISMILAPFSMVIQAYFSIAVGNLANHHKVAGSVGTFIATYAIQQIIGTIIIAVTRQQAVVAELSVKNTAVRTEYPLADVLNPAMILSLSITILCMIAFWFGTKYIMTKKLNLQ